MSSLVKTVILAIPVGITFVDVVGYIARVDGESMKPTLNPNSNDSEFVFLNKYKARDYSVNRGEIVSLISPKDPQQRIIKRVVAMAGDTVRTLGYREKFVKIPEGHLWIEGDHSANSLDSNTFGPVPLGLLTAKASHVIWPLSRWKKLDSVPKRDPIKFASVSHLKS